MDGVSSSLWAPISIRAKIGDRTRWYNIDEDSDVIMETTQGVFLIAIQNPPALTGTQRIPLLLHYTIEFKDNAIQPSPMRLGTPYDFNAVTFTQRATELRGQYHASTGTALPNNTVAKINYPTVDLPTYDGPVRANWIAKYDNAPLSHGFYRNREDALAAQNAIVAQIYVGGTFNLPGLNLSNLA
jgi:hypothetical protein